MCYVAWHPERHASFLTFPRGTQFTDLCPA
ncbi:hypothetical protein EF082_22990 [Escherichia coli]|nr:hypothetical protein [Escherichia coli]EFW3495606.1 hypothetical protein [Shigella flexneri]